MHVLQAAERSQRESIEHQRVEEHTEGAFANSLEGEEDGVDAIFAEPE